MNQQGIQRTTDQWDKYETSRYRKTTEQQDVLSVRAEKSVWIESFIL